MIHGTGEIYPGLDVYGCDEAVLFTPVIPPLHPTLRLVPSARPVVDSLFRFSFSSRYTRRNIRKRRNDSRPIITVHARVGSTTLSDARIWHIKAADRAPRITFHPRIVRLSLSSSSAYYTCFVKARIISPQHISSEIRSPLCTNYTRLLQDEILWYAFEKSRRWNSANIENCYLFEEKLKENTYLKRFET